MESALWGLAVALVAALGAWLEWHSRSASAELATRVALLENRADRQAADLERLEGEVANAESQAHKACEEAANARNACLELVTHAAKRRRG